MSDALIVKELAIQATELVTGADGVQYSRTVLHPVIYDPMPAELEVRTLSGLVEYTKDNKGEMKTNGCFAIVDGPRSVRVLGALTRSMKRKTIIHAEVGKTHGFQFGQWIDHEEFIIKLNSLFVQNAASAELTKFVSKINTAEGFKVEDDGVTQHATLTSGLSGALKEGKQAPVRVKLQPFRTFPEISQTPSEFLFRMRKGGGNSVSCALFEADGGIWEKECAAEIAAWLKKNLAGDVKVIC